MEVLTLLLAVGIVLVIGAIALFARSVSDATFDHADRLSLLPLDDDAPRASNESASLKES